MKDNRAFASELAVSENTRALPRNGQRRVGFPVIAVVPILLVLITFLFWYQTWFGRPLSDADMAKDLTDLSVPHKTQHALAQLSERIARGDPTARRWYPQIVKLVENRQSQFRLMAAWVMGQDNRSQEFHQKLLNLVSDPDPMVRANAALGLARFNDATSEPQLRLMLHPHMIEAPKAGTITFRVKEGEAVRSGTVLARISAPDRSQPTEVRSSVTGQVERRVVSDNAKVFAGDQILVLAPSEEQVWESLRALYLVGGPDDLGDVERLTNSAPNRSERIRHQAALTLTAIRKRAVTSNK